MRYEYFIGTRYLMAKRRSSVVSIITVISVTGVALGVTALIVVLSVMGGFKKDLMQKILGTKAHAVVQMIDQEPMPDATEVATSVRGLDGVIGASAYLEGEVMVSSLTGLSGVVLRGISTDTVGDVSNLPRDIEKGKLEYLDDPKPLVDELAQRRERERDAFMKRFEREAEEREQARREREASGAPGTRLEPDDDVDVLEGFEMPAPELAPPKEAPAREEKQEKQEAQADGPEMVDLSGRALPEADGIPDFGDDDGMPSLFGDEEDDGGMPSLFGDDEEDEEERGVPGLIIGKELAKSLAVGLGDEVNVVTPNGDLGPTGRMPRSRPFKVVGIFYSGMYEYDANYAYTRLDESMDFLGVDGATGVELKTVDVEQAVEVAGRVQSKLGEGFEVLDWMELNRSLFYALKLEKIAMFVVLTFIILVASFSIVAMLIMIVIEKGREIAVLKALGATNGGVMRAFIYQGTLIGVVGAFIGLGLGLGICYLLKEVGFPLDSNVYYISTLPVEIDPTEVVLVVVCAIGIAALATIYPSIQAAKLKPVDGLRDD
jgi:lipoprotein-releasing system permease protein